MSNTAELLTTTVTMLKLNKHNFGLAKAGKKKTTIRLGCLEVAPGAAVLQSSETGEKLPINIWYVNRDLSFGSLELNDAKLDGFKTVEDLRAELRLCYQRSIGQFEQLTQIHFDVIGK
jgi:hypothetical protein